MKQIVSNYSYSPATNVVTLTGVNIDADQLLLIVAPQVGRTLYNFASVTGTVSAGADTRVTLNASTAGLTTTSPLVIFYDDQASTQTVTGTVTATNNAIDNYLISAFEDAATSDASVAIRVQGTPGYPMPISGTVTVGSSVTISSLPAIAGTVTANLFGEAVGGGPNEPTKLQCDSNGFLITSLYRSGSDAVNYDPVAGNVSVNVKNVSSVTIGSLPAISGTVTVGNNNFNIKTVIAQDGSANFFAFNATQFRLYTPIGASKTLNNIFGATPSWVVAFTDSVTWVSESGTEEPYFHDGTQWTLADFTTPAGTLALDGSVFRTNLSYESSINLLNGFTAAQLGTAYINDSGALRVSVYSGTVTAAAPNGSLTTRFGTPTTANVSFATSAVTNANRKYLLIQNVTTGSNVITVGIGFTPTTTQGIQLTAGAGITFESSYIPTGQIFVLSSVTASNFTILEA
jgi:hypothetical protein